MFPNGPWSQQQMKKGVATVKTIHEPSFQPLSFPRVSKLYRADLPQQFILQHAPDNFPISKL